MAVDNNKRLSVGVDLYIDSKTVNSIKNDLKSVKKELDDYVNSLSDAKKAVKGLSDAQEKHNSTTKEQRSTSDKAKKDLLALQEQYAKLERSVKKASVSMSRDNFNFDQANRIKSDMRGVISAFERGEMSSNEAQLALKKLNMEYKNLSNNATVAARQQKIAAKESETFGGKVFDIVKKFGLWAGISTIIYGTVNALRDGVQTVIELDTAMVELRKVTDETAQTYARFEQQAFNVAKRLSAVTTDVINATSGFARMGYTMEQSLDLAETAIILKNVGDGIGSIDEATNAIIATMKGFNFEADQANKIIDSVNEVSNKFAVNTAALTEGIRRTSAVLNQTNTTFDETLGLLTGGIEVIQNTEKVSSGLITISARLRGISEDGEEIPGLMSELEETFQRVAGVDITDVNGELRSTYNILGDLADVYPTLTSSQQQYLAELAAGKRQVPVFQAIISNWESVAKATDTAANSAGSAEKEMENFTNSLQGQINTLKTTVQEFWETLIDEGLISSAIQFLTTLIELFTDLAENIVPVTAALGGFFSVLAVAKLSAIAGAVTGLSGAFAGLTSVLTGTMLVANPLALVIGGLGLVLGTIYKNVSENKKIQEDYNDALREYNEITKEGKKSVEDFSDAETDRITSLVEEYRELNEELESYQSNLSGSRQGSRENLNEVERLKNNITQLKTEMLALGLTVEEATDVIEKKTVVDAAMAQGARYAAQAAEHQGEVTEDSQEKINKALDETKDAYKEYVDELSSDYDLLTERQKEQVDAYYELEIAKSRATAEQAQARLDVLKAELNERRKILIRQLEEEIALGMSDDEALMRLQKFDYGSFVQEQSLLDIVDRSTLQMRKLQQEYDKITSSKADSNSATKQEIELLTDNERALRDNLSAINQLQQQIQRAEGEEIPPLVAKQVELYQKRLQLLDKQLESLKEQKSTIDSTSKEGLKEIENIESEILAIEEQREGVLTTIDGLQEQQKKSLEEYQKQQEKFAHDLRMRIESALKESYKRDLENFKRNQEEKKRKIDEEIEALERRFDTDVYEKEQEELNDRIAALVKERKMLEIEGSLDAKARIAEIDKEVYDLKEELAENQAKREFELEKQKLEDRKEAIDEETRREEEKYRMMMEVNKEYIEEAARMMEEAMSGTFDKIMELLGEFDEEFIRDGELMGEQFGEAVSRGMASGLNLKVLQNVEREFGKETAEEQAKKWGYEGYESPSSGGSTDKTSKPSKPSTSNKATGTSKKVLENVEKEYGREAAMKQAEKWGYSGYSEGGLADFTGMAMIHGSQSDPEAVLNPDDTKLFRNDLPELLRTIQSQTQPMGMPDIETIVNVYPQNGYEAEDAGKKIAKGMKEGLLSDGFRFSRR